MMKNFAEYINERQFQTASQVGQAYRRGVMGMSGRQAQAMWDLSSQLATLMQQLGPSFVTKLINLMLRAGRQAGFSDQELTAIQQLNANQKTHLRQGSKRMLSRQPQEVVPSAADSGQGTMDQSSF